MTAPDPSAYLLQAATNAGALYNDVAVALIDKTALIINEFGAVTNAAELMAKLQAAKPALFRKHARDMTTAEVAAAKAGLIRDHRARQRADDQARTLERISRKFQK